MTINQKGETMLILETRSREHGDLVRRFEAEPSAIGPDFLDELADQESWDYEQHGATRTYLVFGDVYVPLRDLRPPYLDDEG